MGASEHLCSAPGQGWRLIVRLCRQSIQRQLNREAVHLEDFYNSHSHAVCSASDNSRVRPWFERAQDGRFFDVSRGEISWNMRRVLILLPVVILKQKVAQATVELKVDVGPGAGRH